MKYSIIIPTQNNLSLLVGCISSVYRNSKDFEIIVANDCSTDGTTAYLDSILARFKNLQYASFDKPVGFATAVNAGLGKATGDYLVLLNNDTIVTPGWLNQMSGCIPKAEKFFDISKIGIVGPVTNNAGGDQQIATDPYDVDSLDVSAPDHSKAYKDKFMLSGFISGFCMMITRACFKAVGFFDVNFKIGGWEDNDYVLRAQHAGFKSVIDQSTFIHHYGQSTLKHLKINYSNIFRSNQLHFLDKNFTDGNKKLITVCRARNASSYLHAYLTNVSKFSDEIIILLDRTTDDSLDICNLFPKVSRIMTNNHKFDEISDRTRLLKEAQAHKADWILSLDSDELMEDSFTYEYAHLLMNPLNPEILGYMFNFFNFFNGQTHFRTDGTFGNMHGARMWKALPDQHPRSVGHQGLHCTHGPMLGKFNLRMLRSRIKHYGYDSPDKCLTKYKFYSELDPNPDPVSVGPIGYRHLISEHLSLCLWTESNTLSLCMVVKNEEINLFSFLYRYYHYFDEIIIVDTGSTDRTIHIAQLFGAQVYNYKWDKDFSCARNFAKLHCTCNWILSLDPDEEIDLEDFKTIYKLIEETAHGYLFQVINFLPNGQTAYSDNVRLIRNIPEIYYSNLVHENITKSVSKNKLTILTCPVFIKHYGFLKDRAIKAAKNSAYFDMLTRQIKLNPKDANGYFHMAFFFFEKNNETKGFECLQKCIELQPNFFIAHKELALKHLVKSSSYFEQLSNLIPEGHYFNKWAKEVFSRVQHAINCYPNEL